MAANNDYRVRKSDKEIHDEIVKMYFGDFIPYIAVKGGISNDFENMFRGGLTSAAVSGAVGLKTVVNGLYLRGEVEYVYHQDNINYVITDNITYRDEYELNSVQANFIIDFLPGYKVKPYMGYGIGWLNLKDKSTDALIMLNVDQDLFPPSHLSSESRRDFFLHGFLVGASFNLSGALVADLGFRYMRTNDFERADGYHWSHEQKLITLGLRYEF